MKELKTNKRVTINSDNENNKRVPICGGID